uniref:Uncharacterized protein LOC100177124 n=1 Tax=Phallusia mammillata TaxID=59560 RepID=A0A6F9DH54_9ASCI|nr:uncharacterized protein LOC100177124 [Phallusia mammillata]
MRDTEQEFFEECKKGNVNKLKNLIDLGIDLNIVRSSNSKDGKEMSALCVASLEGQLEVVKFLISRSADVNYRSKTGESALFLAAQKGHAKIVQCLLEAGAKMVYTAKSGEHAICKNWEVFCQALRHAYPKDIDAPENSAYKSVAQVLIDHNADSNRPNVMYEALYCELTVFANPIAVYCVGVYSMLNGQQNSALFCEEHFLNAICRASHVSTVSDFINTIQCLLEASKPKQKDAALKLVKAFNWADLLIRLSEDHSRSAGGQQDLQSRLKVVGRLMNVLQLLVSNFSNRSDLLEQFRTLSAEDMGRIGRLIKILLDYETPSETGKDVKKLDAALEDKSAPWNILFFLLKHQLRTGQDSCVSRLLVRNPSPTDYETRILLRSLEDDLSLAHMLLDFGVRFNGECLLKSVQNGLLDLVNRFKSDRELLFCKEIDDLLRIPPSVKNSSNRNMRRCLKIIKSQRVTMEEERRKNEAELFDDISNDPKNRKRRRQRGKAKKTKPSLANDIIDHNDNKKCNDHISDSTDEKEELVQTDNKLDVENDVEDINADGDHVDENCAVPKVDSSKGRKKKNKKKTAGGKKKVATNKNEEIKQEEEEIHDDKSAEILKKTTQQNRWSEVAVITARRRRQSSSSSECSIGARKSVHFSHPLVFYENTKKDPNPKLKHNGNAQPKMSNLKQWLDSDTNILQSEAYRTKSFDNGSPILENDILVTDGFNAIDSDIPWNPVSLRWAPRFEDLSEMDVDSLRQLHWTDNEGNEQTAFVCDNQKHLHIGTGPDYSNIYLSLTSQGQEVAVKKVNSKRAPLLSQKGITSHLLDLPTQTGLNKYISIVKDKGHCYVIQPVGEFSLDEVFRRKVASLPIPAAQGCHHLAEALYFLHQNDILHMAIKPTNVILTSDNELRLTDYGIHCRQTSAAQRQTLGPTLPSLCWMMREVFSDDNQLLFTPASDVASLGMVMFYMLTNGGHPFGDPDTLPIVCISNISRGMYNLKAIADKPLAHHLVRHMIQKDADKRFTMGDVVKHPFLWSEEKKDHYLTLLMEKGLSNAVLDDGTTIIEKLQTVEHELLRSYAHHDKLVNVADIYTSSGQGLLTLMYDCAHNYSLFAQCTKDEERESMKTSVQYFRACFPGLLLSTYRIISVDELEKAVCVPDVPDVPGSPAPFGNTGCNFDEASESISSVTSEEANLTKHETDEKSEESFEMIDIQDNTTLSRKQKDNVVVDKPKQDEDQKDPVPHQEEGEGKRLLAGKDWKNPSLCLTPREDEIEEDFESSVPRGLMSPEANECIIINEGEWTNQSSSSDQDSDNIVEYNSPNAHSIKIPPTHEQKPPEIVSPDDWIEIGSPLSDCETKPVKVDCSAQASSADDTPSSGCSVDDCFDFGSYSKGNGGVEFIYSGDRMVQKKATGLYGNANKSSSIMWTDIDELD